MVDLFRDLDCKDCQAGLRIAQRVWAPCPERRFKSYSEFSTRPFQTRRCSGTWLVVSSPYACLKAGRASEKRTRFPSTPLKCDYMALLCRTWFSAAATVSQMGGLTATDAGNIAVKRYPP